MLALAGPKKKDNSWARWTSRPSLSCPVRYLSAEPKPDVDFPTQPAVPRWLQLGSCFLLIGLVHSFPSLLSPALKNCLNPAPRSPRACPFSLCACLHLPCLHLAPCTCYLNYLAPAASRQLPPHTSRHATFAHVHDHVLARVLAFIPYLAHALHIHNHRFARLSLHIQIQPSANYLLLWNRSRVCRYGRPRPPGTPWLVASAVSRLTRPCSSPSSLPMTSLVRPLRRLHDALARRT